MHTAPLSQRTQVRQRINQLCRAAVQQQITQGRAAPTQRRNRRRFLAKQVLKRIPQARACSARQLLHSVTLVLALWGFGGLVAPQQAQAAAVFQHPTLNGFDVGQYAAPTFADIDGDGDLDAFVGNDSGGDIKYYRNDGAAGFVADAANNPLAGFTNPGYTQPTFADIDGDGDLDAFVGSDNGLVNYYRNDGADGFFATGAATPPNGTPVINPLAGFDVGRKSAPTFADIDGDGDLDAFVGNDSGGGINYYRNDGADGFFATGAATPPNGTPVINPLAGFAVAVGYSNPAFADIDGDGDLDAFVGEGNGSVKYYRNDGADGFFATGGATPPNGTPVINPLAGFDVGNYAAPTFADIDGDGDLDAFVGEGNGSVKYYRNDAGTFVAADPLASFDVGSRAAPTFADIDGDGDLDAFVGERLGTVKYYRNDGAAGFASDAAGNPLTSVTVGTYAAPTFADIDGDGDLDAFVGEKYGSVNYYRNDGATGFIADAAGNPLTGVDVGYDANPAFADIDGDGDLDAFVGERLGTVKYYRNDGATGFVADAAGNPLAGVAVGSQAAPTFTDIDNDGDLDAFVGNVSGTINYYRNDAGTFVADTAPPLAGFNPLASFDVGSRAAPTFADIDGDGDLDAFVGDILGGVKFFENLESTTASNGGGSGGGGTLAPWALLMLGLLRLGTLLTRRK